MPPPVFISSDELAARAGFFRRHSVALLTEALENKTPSEQRNMLGENLYPLVELLEPMFAAKITGMLLEMPRNEIFQCIESPKALEKKVNEAIIVLMDWFPQQMNMDEQETKVFRAAMRLSKL